MGASGAARIKCYSQQVNPRGGEGSGTASWRSDGGDPSLQAALYGVGNRTAVLQRAQGGKRTTRGGDAESEMNKERKNPITRKKKEKKKAKEQRDLSNWHRDMTKRTVCFCSSKNEPIRRHQRNAPHFILVYSCRRTRLTTTISFPLFFLSAKTPPQPPPEYARPYGETKNKKKERIGTTLSRRQTASFFLSRPRPRHLSFLFFSPQGEDLSPARASACLPQGSTHTPTPSLSLFLLYRAEPRFDLRWPAERLNFRRHSYFRPSLSCRRVSCFKRRAFLPRFFLSDCHSSSFLSCLIFVSLSVSSTSPLSFL